MRVGIAGNVTWVLVGKDVSHVSYTIDGVEDDAPVNHGSYGRTSLEREVRASAMKRKQMIAAIGAGVLLILVGTDTLTTQSIYPRRSSGYTGIGFKPQTTCSVRVGRIKHQNVMRYREGLVFWKTAYKKTTSRTGLSKWEQKDILRRCKSVTAGKTTWQGGTIGTVVYRGRTYRALVTTRTEKIACKP